jgi:hypothetical protein
LRTIAGSALAFAGRAGCFPVPRRRFGDRQIEGMAELTLSLIAPNSANLPPMAA